MEFKTSLVLLVTLLISSFSDSTFVTKVSGGLERIVVSIDENLALPPTSSSPTGSTTGLKGATHECQTVLEQLKEILRRTSDNLYKATKGETYFRQISILLPPNWANGNCTGADVGTASYQTASSADIALTSDHPVYIDKPWTLQYGPCGTAGKKISIPVSFLRNESEMKARLLVREWAKYRYGVFDENGFAHDEKYPAEFVDQNGKLVQTACHLNRTCGDGEKCEEKSEKNLEPTTPQRSLMSLPLDPTVNEFCNEKAHIRTTPTKQNFLCDGRSIWEVMREHSDFAHNVDENNKGSEKVSSSTSSSTDRSGVPPTSFTYVTAKSHRMIFLLDRTKTMNDHNRWGNVRRSLYRMFHYIPSGVELGVVSYTGNSSTPAIVSLPLTIATTHNRDHLHGRIPLRPLSSEDPCLSCALKTAFKLIKSSNENVGPTTLVIVSGSPSRLSAREWEKMTKMMDNSPVRLVLITYANESSELIRLAGSGGLFKMPEATNRQSNLEQNEELNNVFLEIISKNIGLPLNKVYEEKHMPDNEWQSRGKFTIEESLGRNTWVTVTTEESGDVDGLQLVSPTGKEFELPLQTEGLVFLKIPGVSENGVWSYVIKFYQDRIPKQVSVDVITESRKPESISVKFWNKVVRGPSALAVGNSEVVLLFAQVLQGELPVLNANVTATVSLPGHFHHHGPNTLNVRLLDTGNGDPDITWGDGIYSAYFTQLGPNPGLFSITAHIDDNNGLAVVPVHTNITRGHLDSATCCGSSVPHIATIPTGSFTRKMAGSSFQVKQGVPFGEDPYPPGRVTDLRVERVVDSTSEVKLSWTAPGGDFDKGKAARYEIRCYTSRDALTNENFGTQGILVHSSLTPEPVEVGVRQSCNVGVPWSNEIFYYGIVAIDAESNRGKVSNLVSVLIKEAPTSPTLKIIDAWEDDALVSNLTSSRNNKADNVFQAGATWIRGLNELEFYLIVGGAAAFFLLVSTFILVLVFMKRNKNKNTEAPPAYHNIYVTNNGKGPQVVAKDGLCCWENESNTTETSSNQPPKISGINGPYLAEAANSYIPASALCAPPVGSIYRDMYAGSGSTGQTHDSSSVDSKPSDGGGSNETVHVSDGMGTPGSSYYSHHNGHLVSNGPQYMSANGHHVTRVNFDTSLPQERSDDDEGGFKARGRGSFHKVIHMPSGIEYDSPSIMNGSTYGGSIMSIPNSNKKRTRHISFV